MQIFIVTDTGETFALSVKPSDTIQRVKELVADRDGTPPDLLRLIIFAGERLEGSRTIADYNIQDGSTLKLQTLQIPWSYPPGVGVR